MQNHSRSPNLAQSRELAIFDSNIYTMLRTFLFLCLTAFSLQLFSQTNIKTSQEIENVLVGNYNPGDYHPASHQNQTAKNELIDRIIKEVSPDSIKKIIEEMNQFRTRHSASDTVSNSSGIGAARRWAYNRLVQMNEQNSGASNSIAVCGYLDFEVDMCGVMEHRNVLAVIPGLDDNLAECIVIEAHLDSRCESGCDTSCIAKGMEDNASGVALVMEMFRLLKGSHLDRTLVFMLTTGEEQGLHGGRALAKFASQKDINIRCVQNNDVIGGIICGKTASPPGCPGENLIDSTQVRIFSQGAFNSMHKQYARFVKLQYQEELMEKVNVPMQISIMSAEDRTGRGGDHIPFREEGFTAIRFTSAHEHGDGHADGSYTDRQHSQGDVLGEDTDNDGKIDQYFVDFNYLSRNTQINTLAAAMAAIGPETPSFTLNRKFGTILEVRITDPTNYNKYRIALHTSGHEWDTVITLTADKNINIDVEPDRFYFVSVASVDNFGTESLFTGEQSTRTNGINANPELNKVDLLTNRPNPFDFATTIAFFARDIQEGDEAEIRITNLKGQLVATLPLKPKNGMNEVLYEHGYGKVGHFQYGLYINGQLLASKRMIFAN